MQLVNMLEMIKTLSLESVHDAPDLSGFTLIGSWKDNPDDAADYLNWWSHRLVVENGTPWSLGVCVEPVETETGIIQEYYSPSTGALRAAGKTGSLRAYLFAVSMPKGPEYCVDHQESDVLFFLFEEHPGVLVFLITVSDTALERHELPWYEAMGLAFMRERKRVATRPAGGRPSKQTPEKLTRLHELVDRGRSIPQIAKDLGIDERTVRRWLRDTRQN